jgi:hypothetical protein
VAALICLKDIQCVYNSPEINNPRSRGNHIIRGSEMEKIKIRHIARLICLGFVLIAISTESNAATSSGSHHDSTAYLKPDDSTAVVSFIRRSVFMGDGWNYDVWDGDQYVGLLGAGKLLQHRASPGEHLYMLMARGVHVWAYMKANVVAGKEYFARAYPIPFSLQSVNSTSDERVDTWATMKIGPPPTDKERKKAFDKFGNEMEGALAAFQQGKIPHECALWVPPHQDGKESKQPSHGSGECRALSEMHPEDGR